MTSSNHSSERKTQEKSPTVGHQNPPTTGQWHHRKFTNKCRIFARQRCFQVFNLFNVPREHTKTASRRNSTYHVTHVPTYGSTTTPLQSLQARISKLAPEPVLGLPASHVSMLAPPMPARQHVSTRCGTSIFQRIGVATPQHVRETQLICKVLRKLHRNLPAAPAPHLAREPASEFAPICSEVDSRAESPRLRCWGIANGIKKGRDPCL